MNWIRVSRHEPCGICHKPDWCTRGESGWCCMRVESPKPMHNGGWFHRFDQSLGVQAASPPLAYRRRSTSMPIPDFDMMLSEWKSSHDGAMDRLSSTLGVSKQSLLDLNGCYSQYYHAYAFPMCSPDGATIGIRLRSDNPDHRKFAVKGSKSALFIPFNAAGRLSVHEVLVCEGPTDTSAALTLGLFAIGRPACLGCEEMVASVLRELGTSEAILCYDNDGPGVRGAEKLAQTLPCRVTRFVPPCKDLRGFLNAGGTKQVLLSMINNTLRSWKA